MSLSALDSKSVLSFFPLCTADETLFNRPNVAGPRADTDLPWRPVRPDAVRGGLSPSRLGQRDIPYHVLIAS